MRIGLQELLRKAQVEGDADFLKEGVRALSRAIMEMEVEDHIGAARHERSPGRTGQRNGYRQRLWDTRVGAVELKVPRVRDSKATSPHSLSRADAPSGRSVRWCTRPTSTGSLPARSMSW